MLDAHIAAFFNTNEAGEGLSKRLLTSTSLMPPIGTFVRPKENMATEDKNYSTNVASKGSVTMIPGFQDDRESTPSRFSSWDEKYVERSHLNGTRIFSTIGK